ncbi:cupin domain-containing protein [Homoserinimonas sp. OAct 916]|uniref:cupin domain-containing protein n=1 Tax=Homoserinimonas sp. OAct 916 TaxID=2211450 RepID=UPI000DBE91F5|nr:cupin domain-containing protein [Homoserinimonas sp. OAct 916]
MPETTDPVETIHSDAAPTRSPNESESMIVLGTGTAELISQTPIESGRIRTSRILKAAGARVALLAMDGAQELTEHTAAVPIMIQLLSGRATISAEGTTVELTPGGVVHVDARVPHAVVAAEPSHLLLTLLDPPRVQR